jgi:hypothetical protein
MHYTLCISLRSYCGGSSIVVLCIEDRTPIEVEWQVPLTILRLLYPWFVNGTFENMING